MSETKAVVNPMHFSLKFIKQISIERKLNPQDVITMMKYDVLTPRQLSAITGRDVKTINNLIRENRIDPEKGLNDIYTFRCMFL